MLVSLAIPLLFPFVFGIHAAEEEHCWGGIRPVPVVIPHLANHTFQLDKVALDSILRNPRVANKKVVLVSIAGRFRGGKSFLLNFFLRYLYYVTDSKKNSTDWLDPAYKLEKRFCFRGGSQLHTRGILIWPEPILMMDSRGEEVAVLLMDTQGSYDEESTVKDNAVIFALSTMVSSMLMYNLQQKIDSKDLEYLQFFAAYANMAMGENGDQQDVEKTEKPFQSIIFLVRDWPFQNEEEFGFVGGETYLNQNLKPRDSDTRELSQLRGDIRTRLFESKRCFLMPYPGDIIAGNSPQKFSGNLTEISPYFLEQVRTFVPAIVGASNVVVKRINGNSITARALSIYFQAYINEFASNKMPEPGGVYLATAKANHLNAKNDALDKYINGMETHVHGMAVPLDERKMEELHHLYLNASIEYYHSIKKLGDATMTQDYLKQMLSKIEDLYEQFKMINIVNIDLANEKENHSKAVENLRDAIKKLEEALKSGNASEEAIKNLQDGMKLARHQTKVAECREAYERKRSEANARALKEAKTAIWNFFEGVGNILTLRIREGFRKIGIALGIVDKETGEPIPINNCNNIPMD